ncbi:PqqD family protein [Actinotalea sp. AC32]|nr:PqqD family protein [Actinotalea sp. AC32]
MEHDGTATSTGAGLRLREGAVSWREIDDEVVVLDLGHSEYLSVNASGAVLWSLLAAGTTRDALVDALVDRFDLDRGRGEADVDAFLASARERDLLEG